MHNVHETYSPTTRYTYLKSHLYFSSSREIKSMACGGDDACYTSNSLDNFLFPYLFKWLISFIFCTISCRFLYLSAIYVPFNYPYKFMVDNAHRCDTDHTVSMVIITCFLNVEDVYKYAAGQVKLLSDWLMILNYLGPKASAQRVPTKCWLVFGATGPG